MKKPFAKILASISLVVGFTSLISAQAFEGSIEFVKRTATDTTTYVYHIKGDKVRIDEIGSKSKKVEGSYIVDLTGKTKMIFMSHERKTFGENSSGAPATVKGTPVVTKTKNVKKIKGYDCTEYIVTNKEENTQISYWIANNQKFDFFAPLLKLLNRKDKFSTYYQQIKDLVGAFSFLAIQSTGNKETGKLEVTKIEKKGIDASLFEIPKDYKKFQ